MDCKRTLTEILRLTLIARCESAIEALIKWGVSAEFWKECREACLERKISNKLTDKFFHKGRLK